MLHNILNTSWRKHQDRSNNFEIVCVAELQRYSFGHELYTVAVIQVSMA